MNLQFTTIAVVVFALSRPAAAQDASVQSAAGHQHHVDHAADGPRAWTWTADANVFFGYNYQQRKFADFTAWESQNWVMAAAARPLGGGRLTLSAMSSLEPLTMHRIGSPQLFQTGETYQQSPLTNYQHPHDAVMELGATYRVERAGLAYAFTGALVGSPALGPTAFMHRESARDNPQVPLNHHSLDATHITTGVVTAGVQLRDVTVEASAFRGAEPDENRWNIERPRLDSWSSRVGWRRGAWQAQVSGGRLHEPEWFEPYDVTRLTASIEFDGAAWSRPLAATVAWGRNIEYNGFDDKADGYLAEASLKASRLSSIYGRAERAKKQLFGLGFHPKGFNHPHTYSLMNAFTIGYIRDLTADRRGRIGIGADVTGYRTSEDLRLFYGSSHSYHVFVRWRPSAAAPAHVH